MHAYTYVLFLHRTLHSGLQLHLNSILEYAVCLRKEMDMAHRIFKKLCREVE